MEAVPSSGEAGAGDDGQARAGAAMAAPRARRWWRGHGLVVPLYLLVALLYTYPTALRLDSAIAGRTDEPENYWNLWWTYQALVEQGQHPYHATAIYHPAGSPLYFHTFNFLNGLISLPLQACCGTTVAFNLMNIFALVMAGLGAYALTWHLTRRRPAAFLAGLIYALSPYMAFHLNAGQPFMLSLEWFPFFILALLKGLRERWRYLPLAALCFMLIGLTDWHYTSYAVVLTALVGLYELARARSLRGAALVAGKLALVGGLAGLLLAPVLLPMLAELAASPHVERPIEHSVNHTTDLLSFVLPSIFHPLWGDWASEIFYGRLVLPTITGGVATLGFTPLLLALLAVVRERRRSALFLLIFLTFFVLALGPYLQVNGYNSYLEGAPIPLPYLLFRKLPFMSIQRIPSRFVSVVTLALAVLAGIGASWLWGRAQARELPPWRRWALPVLLCALVLFEYWPRPLPMHAVGPRQIPPFYRQLARDQERYAILEVPYRLHTSLLYQTHHQKQLVGGQISRPFPWGESRFFGPMVELRADYSDIGAGDGPEAIFDALRCQQVRYVVFYKRGYDAELQPRSDRLRQELFAAQAPAYEDAELTAYEIAGQGSGRPYWTIGLDEWHAVETTGEGPSYRWAKGQEASLLIYPCAGATDTMAQLSLSLSSADQERTVRVAVNGVDAGTVRLEQGRGQRLQLAIPLRPGENRVTFTSVEPAVAAASLGFAGDPRTLSFRIAEVKLEQ